jgi:hypothetical protein
MAVLSGTATTKFNLHNKATINSAVEWWYVEKGAWTTTNLSETVCRVANLNRGPIAGTEHRQPRSMFPLW